jgi:hypothetical protein
VGSDGRTKDPLEPLWIVSFRSSLLLSSLPCVPVAGLVVVGLLIGLLVWVDGAVVVGLLVWVDGAVVVGLLVWVDGAVVVGLLVLVDGAVVVLLLVLVVVVAVVGCCVVVGREVLVFR